MLDKSFIGKALPSFYATAEAGQLALFVKATGETRPEYIDESAARDAGHPSVPLPPTFLFSLELSHPSAGWRKDIGIEPSRILHGEQRFSYHRPAYAGEKLLFESRIADIYDKKGGALSFVVRETRVTNPRGEYIADLRSVLVHRND
ncbi:Acyl dehydratase [Candidatus Burkholderia verschuerenii]|uniref:Acyl dehydratase n=1 Tax=Candidatus Burkholderia verschuerenii TaxID=242163 RepID=A0A0L0MF38_9BURK|nr:MaoC family dehydratase N-terminal domain-containing protein [Candidatus Burkholderia verschuerenii]KND61307.1 Acyl dehydratase [Candidatus Burkholderia verschuerenii]